MSRTLLLSLCTALLSCATTATQPSASIPLLRWEPHVKFNSSHTDLVGWIGLRVSDSTVKLIEHPRSSCHLLERSHYHDYGIPSDALTAAAGWYAGGGEQFYVVLRGSSLLVFHRTDEEGGDRPPYRMLKRIPLPRSTSNQTMQLTATRRALGFIYD